MHGAYCTCAAVQKCWLTTIKASRISFLKGLLVWRVSKSSPTPLPCTWASICLNTIQHACQWNGPLVGTCLRPGPPVRVRRYTSLYGSRVCPQQFKPTYNLTEYFQPLSSSEGPSAVSAKLCARGVLLVHATAVCIAAKQSGLWNDEHQDPQSLSPAHACLCNSILNWSELDMLVTDSTGANGICNPSAIHVPWSNLPAAIIPCLPVHVSEINICKLRTA